MPRSVPLNYSSFNAAGNEGDMMRWLMMEKRMWRNGEVLMKRKNKSNRLKKLMKNNVYKAILF
jgi:hypothetical protein